MGAAISRRRATRSAPADTATVAALVAAFAIARDSARRSAVEDQAQAAPRRRNRMEPAVPAVVDHQQLEEDASRGSKRQRRQGPIASVQSNVPAADEVPPTVARTLTCPICLSDMEEPSTTICGHVFCDKCIKEAVRVQKECPYCRKKLRKNSIRRIYLPTSDN